MSNIRQWLDDQGFGQYADAFDENEIGLDLLSRLTDEALEKLGVGVMGHRIRMLDAIAARSRDDRDREGHQALEGAEAKSANLPDHEAERRQLTVMFCDMVGSTALSEQLDAEELREVVLAYQQTSAEVIGRFDGHIAQYLGDGLLVYFGYPMAHEDDAERAVRAGLGIVDALHDLNTRSQHPIQVRVGLHTGQVVVGEMGGGGRHEQLALGETPNIAARVQGLAAPDAVVISAATYKLVEGLFTSEALGPKTLKGITAPLSLYQVVGENDAYSRFDAAVKTGLTPMVGRAEEVGLLERHWERVKEGNGQVVLLSGEAGIGKSRLVQVLKDHVLHDDTVRIEYRCSPYYQNTSLYPIIEHLKLLLAFTPHEAGMAKFEKLERMLAEYHFPQDDTLALLADLLSLPLPDGCPPLDLSSKQHKQRTKEAMIAWILEEAERHAVYVAWEDLHWADPSTIEVLELFLEHVPTARLLAVLTFRPEFRPPWKLRSHISHIMLSRLGRAEGEQMVGKVTAGKTLPVEVMQQIVTKTDGVPLFVEELTKMVIESGLLRTVNNHYELTGPLPPLAIPSTLQDSLMARLDRMGSARELAQLGATLGREFSYDLIQAVSLLDEVTLQHGLAQLVEAELIYRKGLPPQARYLFKHELVQDTAYQSLLKTQRQQFHQRIAEVLEQKFPEVVTSQPEFLAHHYTEASLAKQAIPYWQQAGERAMQLSASIEAIGHFTKALDVLQSLPDTPERARRELQMQLALLVPLQTTKSHASPEIQQACDRALELYRQMGKVLDETPELFRALRGLSAFYGVRGDFETARELAEQLLWLAERSNATALILQAHQGFGFVQYGLGELATARSHFEKTIALYEPRNHHPRQLGTVDDSRVVAKGQLASVLWHLGYPDQARARSYEAVKLAEELSHPFSRANALMSVVVVHCLRLEARQALEHAEKLIELSTEQGFGQWLVTANTCVGYTLTKSEQLESGILKMRQGVQSKAAAGALMGLPFYLALLADGCARAGRRDEGLAVVREALGMVEETGQRVDEAELHRLMGILLLTTHGREGGVVAESDQNGTALRAEQCLEKALNIARMQQAKSWELRASTSLARLWQQQDKKTKAHELLSEIYNWFTEGFDTKDLKDAKALLEELA